MSTAQTKLKMHCSACGHDFDPEPGVTPGSLKMPDHNAACGRPCGKPKGADPQFHGMNQQMGKAVARWCPACGYLDVVKPDSDEKSS